MALCGRIANVTELPLSLNQRALAGLQMHREGCKGRWRRRGVAHMWNLWEYIEATDVSNAMRVVLRCSANSRQCYSQTCVRGPGSFGPGFP
ncbi:unnamed protein product [Toxocara canis]|uniref:Uncharacterized protein n=1 Tax=Toxocara canis TaxID=6265 RepID=A0A183UCR3_TOXCA|nr:unnamed protein product [Toxocara canis]